TRRSSDLASALLNKGDIKGAIAMADDMAMGEKVAGAMLYNAACIYALSSIAVKADVKRKEQYAVRAVALLRRALATGDLSRAQVLHMKTYDHDLDALRSRDDVQKLISEMKKDSRP